MLLHFYKMNGAGNDFIVVDNLDLTINLDAETIEALCDRHRGVGADGLLAVEPSQNGADYRFRYYNADGGEAEMCGNGARCFGRFTSCLGKETVDQVSFETIAGTLTAYMVGDDVKINMSEPKDIQLKKEVKVKGLNHDIHFINTGVPHAVIFVDDLENLDVFTLGNAIRFHEAFAPAGTNVNFAKIINANHIEIRTYERGVEDETLACGTGMVACSLIHHLLTKEKSPVKVDVAGGDTLEIGFKPETNQTFSNVTLTGPADFVFEGDIQI
jgi:diaminopimelate epimerase